MTGKVHFHPPPPFLDCPAAETCAHSPLRRCPGGESPAQVAERLDKLIQDIRTRFHQPALDGTSDKSDVLIVAHGHILRAFAMRWIGRDLTSGVAMILEAGGVGTLSYEHNKIDEPAILLGGAFMADVVESSRA